jgi:actin-related protein 3
MNFDSKIVVIDNGTGYTKMGHAGNTEPSFDIPTLIAEVPNQKPEGQFVSSKKKVCETLDFSIG